MKAGLCREGSGAVDREGSETAAVKQQRATRRRSPARSSPSFAGHVLAGPLHGERRRGRRGQAANGQHERPNHKPPAVVHLLGSSLARVATLMPGQLAVNNVKHAAIYNQTTQPTQINHSQHRPSLHWLYKIVGLGKRILANSHPETLPRRHFLFLFLPGTPRLPQLSFRHKATATTKAIPVLAWGGRMTSSCKYAATPSHWTRQSPGLCGRYQRARAQSRHYWDSRMGRHLL